MMSARNGDTTGLSANGVVYIRAALRHTKNIIEVDWEKAVEELNIAHPRWVRDRSRQTSTKHPPCGEDESPKIPKAARISQKPMLGESPCKVTKKRASRLKESKTEEARVETERVNAKDGMREGSTLRFKVESLDLVGK